MKLNIKEKIALAAERGLTEEALKDLFTYLYDNEEIKFDDVGNPYWESCGDPLEPDIELEFEE
jgi:hypothetical protein